MVLFFLNLGLARVFKLESDVAKKMVPLYFFTIQDVKYGTILS